MTSVFRGASLLLALLALPACERNKATPAEPPAPAAAAAPAAPAASAGLAYVSNQDGGVSVIDIKTLTVISTMATGATGPRGLGISQDGRLLVTANRDGGNLSVIERQTGTLLSQIPIGENPEFVRMRGDLAFVSFEPESKGGPPPKPGSPEALALQKEREEDEETEPAQIAVVDLKQGKVIRRIVGGLETEGIEFSADGKYILITNEADDTVSVHDIATGAMLKSIATKPYGPRPRGIKIAPDGKRYLVTLEFANKVLVLDDQFDPVQTFDTGEVPNGIAFDARGERLFVALARGKALQVFDARTYAPISSVPTGERCWHFTFTPDDTQILLACGRSHEVVVIDAATLAVTQRIGDMQLPWGIVTWPRSVGSLDAL